MSFKLIPDKKFAKHYSKLTAFERKQTDAKLIRLAENPLYPSLRTKRIQGTEALYESSVNMDISTVKGFKNILFGGEGLFLTTITGPGHVWLQSMPAENVAKSIIPFIADKK